MGCDAVSYYNSGMKTDCVEENGIKVAVIECEPGSITDSQSAMDLALSVKYATGAERLVIDKQALTEEFFELRTGLAGEILQKFINYGIKAAFFGDYSQYASKALRAFILESNRGHDFFFVSTRDEAVRKLLDIQ